MNKSKKQPVSYYDILNVRPNASEQEIKTSYRALAKGCHPDSIPRNEGEAKRRFHELNEAYSHLKSLQKRELYNANLRKKRQKTPSSMAQNDNSQHKHWLMKLLWPTNNKEKAQD